MQHIKSLRSRKQREKKNTKKKGKSSSYLRLLHLPRLPGHQLGLRRAPHLSLLPQLQSHLRKQITAKVPIRSKFRAQISAIFQVFAEFRFTLLYLRHRTSQCYQALRWNCENYLGDESKTLEAINECAHRYTLLPEKSKTKASPRGLFSEALWFSLRTRTLHPLSHVHFWVYIYMHKTIHTSYIYIYLIFIYTILYYLFMEEKTENKAGKERGIFMRVKWKRADSYLGLKGPIIFI